MFITNISKKAIIEGKVHIGKNTKVFENAVIKGPVYIGDNCIIGNNALISDNTRLENGVMIGANAEVKNSIFKTNSHMHSGYIENSTIGENCRIGAGFKGFSCIIGNNTKTGINCSFMPNVIIGSDCLIGPCSVVMKNIEDNKLFYTKFKEVIKNR